MIDLIEPITLALIPGFLLLDFIIRRRHYETTRHWRLRGALVTAAVFFLTGEVAAFWGGLFGDTHLFDLSGLGAWGAIVGVLVYELGHYWYHRAAHQWNWLWRAGHQMHHSAESLDAFGAFYLHPFDGAMFTTISSLVLFPLLGLSIEAGVIAALFLTFNAMFQHADLPLWDMLFGTFRNPRSVAGVECGFYPGASSRIPEMLVGCDVSRPGKDKSAATPVSLSRAA